MKIENVGAALCAGAVVVVLVAVGLVIFRLELDMIYTLALLLVSGLVLAVIVAAAALPIRALKKQDGPHERERIIRHTHTIDREGRVVDAPKIYTLPQQQTGWPGMFPELLRAAYLAGHRGLPGGAQETDPEEADVVDLTEEWHGEIRE